MTIKRRLYISNILMLVVPIIISISVFSGLAYSFLNTMGLWQQDNNTSDFYDVVNDINDFAQQQTDTLDIKQITGYIDSHARNLAEMDVSMAIYHQAEQIYITGDIAEAAMVNTALEMEGSHLLSIDEISIYKTSLGDYDIVVVGSVTEFMSNLLQPETYKRLAFALVVLAVIIVVVVYFTNRALTRMVIKHIITPLETLTYGVRQIRDGNLKYRIHYDGKDEFAAVCDDFNDMAGRLLDMVEARQRDDENRKELIAGISHDLRTPLTSIKAYVEGLEKGVAATPALQKQYLETIRSKTEDLEHIVTQLFLFSKIDIGDYTLSVEALDIGDELRKFIDSVYDEYMARGLDIQQTENSFGLIAGVDIVQLRNVYTNLLENTVKYCDKPHMTMRVFCRRQGANACIIWEDNGPGVPEDALGRIFDVFYRGDKARSNTGQGSGIGLAISAKIMALMGGSIRAENAKAGGLRICLSLPLLEGGNS